MTSVFIKGPFAKPFVYTNEAQTIYNETKDLNRRMP